MTRNQILTKFFIRDLENSITLASICVAMMKADLNNETDNPFFSLSEKELNKKMNKYTEEDINEIMRYQRETLRMMSDFFPDLDGYEEDRAEQEQEDEKKVAENEKTQLE